MKLTAIVFLALTVYVASVAQQTSLSPSPLRDSSLIDWPQLNFDSGLDGYNPYETILSPTTVGNVSLKWSYGAGQVSSQPAVVNGVLYVGTANTFNPFDNTVSAIDANSGTLIWKYGGIGLVLGSLAVANDMVYVATAFQLLYALNAQTGALVWQGYTGDYIESSPVVANGIVYVGAKDQTLYAFDAVTGKNIWQYETAGAIWTTPAVANGILYISSGPSVVYALNASTGALIWKDQLPAVANTSRSAGTFGGQSVANGVLYVGVLRAGQTYDLYALNASTGAFIWKCPAHGFALSTPAVANGMVYIAGGRMTYAIDASSGTVVWQTAIDDDYAYSPTVANGVVYVGYWKVSGGGQGSGTIAAMDASNGKLLWSQSTMGSYYYSFPAPSVVNGTIYGSVASGGQVAAWGLPK